MCTHMLPEGCNRSWHRAHGALLHSSRTYSFPARPHSHADPGGLAEPARLVLQGQSTSDTTVHALCSTTAAAHPAPKRDFRCWGAPKQRKLPWAMMASRVHSASHSSMLWLVSTTVRPACHG